MRSLSVARGPGCGTIYDWVHGDGCVVQVGFKTWYPGAEERYIAKCQCALVTLSPSLCSVLPLSLTPGATSHSSLRPTFVSTANVGSFLDE